MTRSSLQHHRSRVPAIPPCTRNVTLKWQFEMPEWEQDQPPEWCSFLSSHGLDSKLPVRAMQDGHWVAIKEIFRKEGTNLHREITWPPGARRSQVTITVTRPARISPKLLATFPWKLRKQQLQPKGL